MKKLVGILGLLFVTALPASAGAIRWSAKETGRGARKAAHVVKRAPRTAARAVRKAANLLW